MPPKTEPKTAIEWLLQKIEEESGGLIHFADGSTSYATGWFNERTAAALHLIVQLHDHGDQMCWEMHSGIYPSDWPDGGYGVAGGAWSHTSLEPAEVRKFRPCATLRAVAAVFRDNEGYTEWFGGQ